MDLQECMMQLGQQVAHVTGVETTVLDMSLHLFWDHDPVYCSVCKGCNYLNAHLYGAYEADRWNSKYIYYCPRGYIFFATGAHSATAISGPLIMEDCENFDESLPVLTTKAVGALSQLFFENLSFRSDLLTQKTEKNSGQSDLLNMMYDLSDQFGTGANMAYPIHDEQELEKRILDGDRQGAGEVLNRLMGYIYFSSCCDFDVIKSRTIEIIVILSRGIIKAGADAGEIFSLNSGYIKQVESFHNIDSLSLWLTKVAHKFIGYIFDLKDIKHKDIIFKLSSYIKNNYQKKLTLTEVADHVYLSKSYLSKVLKDELGSTFTEYVNLIRVDKSKELLKNSNLSLVDIAIMVGFEDQSYYTKVFKKNTGLSPGKYREQRSSR